MQSRQPLPAPGAATLRVPKGTGGGEWPGSPTEQDSVGVPQAREPQPGVPHASRRWPCPAHPPACGQTAQGQAHGLGGRRRPPQVRTAPHDVPTPPPPPLTSSSQSRGEAPGARNEPLEANLPGRTHLRPAASKHPQFSGQTTCFGAPPTFPCEPDGARGPSRHSGPGQARRGRGAGSTPPPFRSSSLKRPRQTPSSFLLSEIWKH